MQINKSKKRTQRQSSNILLNNDFASGFEDSKFDKFKPALKALVVIILLIGATWGAVAYFGTTDKKDGTNKGYASNTSQLEEDIDAKLSQCLSEAVTANPTPETSDSSFWPKIIAGYDAQLGCYDKYPDAIGVVSRSSTESAREDAIDSSGSYKDTYLSTNSYEYKPPSTGNASQYSASSGSSSTAGSSSSNQPSPSSGSSPSTPSEWELNKAEFDAAVACADNAAASVLIQGAYGSPSYYQQKIEQLEAQLACTSGAKYSMTQERRTWYQSQIATSKARYNDSINPNSPSYYPNSH